MKTSKLLIASMIAVMSLGSCVKDKLHKTSHPEHGKLTLTTDWTTRTEGITIPASYTVKVGENSVNVQGVTNTITTLFTPGDYRLQIFNTADKITTVGNVASVATTDGGKVADSAPGWFFSAAQNVTLTKDAVQTITVNMKQQVRQLTVNLNIKEGNPERIASIAAKLDGVVYQWDIDKDIFTGSAVAIEPTFTRNGSKITATVRLMGILPTAKQNLTVTITFNDGKTYSIESEVTAQLANFNVNKHIPLVLDADLITPVDGSVSATIKNWVVTTTDLVIN